MLVVKNLILYAKRNKSGSTLGVWIGDESCSTQRVILSTAHVHPLVCKVQALHFEWRGKRAGSRVSFRVRLSGDFSRLPKRRACALNSLPVSTSNLEKNNKRETNLKTSIPCYANCLFFVCKWQPVVCMQTCHLFPLLHVKEIKNETFVAHRLRYWHV